MRLVILALAATAYVYAVEHLWQHVSRARQLHRLRHWPESLDLQLPVARGDRGAEARAA